MIINLFSYHQSHFLRSSFWSSLVFSPSFVVVFGMAVLILKYKEMCCLQKVRKLTGYVISSCSRRLDIREPSVAHAKLCLCYSTIEA